MRNALRNSIPAHEKRGTGIIHSSPRHMVCICILILLQGLIGRGNWVACENNDILRMHILSKSFWDPFVEKIVHFDEIHVVLKLPCLF